MASERGTHAQQRPADSPASGGVTFLSQHARHLGNDVGAFRHNALHVRHFRRDPFRNRRSRNLHQDGSALHRPVYRRLRQGIRRRFFPVWHDLRKRHRQRRRHRCIYHPIHEKSRIYQRMGGHRRSSFVHRRSNHAADHGRSRVYHGAAHRRKLHSDCQSRDCAGAAVLSEHIPFHPSGFCSRRNQGIE